MKLAIQIKAILFILFLLGFSISGALAKCTVEKFLMDKTIFQVLKNGKRISEPDLVCKGAPVFSPSGKYIAFTDCERNYNILGDDHRIYELVIFNCETGKDAGYLAMPEEKRESIVVHQWSNDEASLALVKRSEPAGVEEFGFRFRGVQPLP